MYWYSFVYTSLLRFFISSSSLSASPIEESESMPEPDYIQVTFGNSSQSIVLNYDIAQCADITEYSLDTVLFKYYTRTAADEYFQLDVEASPVEPVTNGSINVVRLLPGADVKIITHGWLTSPDLLDAINNIQKNYIKAGNVNVIVVDWSTISSLICYPIPARDTKRVGEYVGKFIDAFARKYRVSGDKFHLIGHSLGAHVMGNAGQASTMDIGRITGLDTARPLFEYPKLVSTDLRLDPSDAIFVDAIHTGAPILGFLSPLADADFFPNDGLIPQPGCTISKLIHSCSHERSCKFFYESIINANNFQSVKCSDWSSFQLGLCNSPCIPMGEHVPHDARGTFYLATRATPEYGTVPCGERG